MHVDAARLVDVHHPVHLPQLVRRLMRQRGLSHVDARGMNENVKPTEAGDDLVGKHWRGGLLVPARVRHEVADRVVAAAAAPPAGLVVVRALPWLSTAA